MLRLTLDETSRSTEHVRSAAIAAMGQRLAAAGPRTRQKVTQRYHPAVETGDPEDTAMPPSANRAAPLVADRAQAFVRETAPLVLPRPRNKVLTALGRAAALGLMASAGFAAVLVAQSPRWSARHNDPAHKSAEIAAARAQPAQLSDRPATPAPALPDPAPQLARNDAPTAPAPAAAPAPAPEPAPRVAPAAEPAALAPKPAASPPPATAPAARPIQVQLALSHRAQRVAAPRPPQIVRHQVQHSVVLAHYDLPRWLTEDRPPAPPPKPLIMSPQPHNLDAPASAPAPAPQQTVVAGQEKPHSAPAALPPLPRPRLLYASAAYPPSPPRGAYYGYPYGYNATLAATAMAIPMGCIGRSPIRPDRKRLP